MIAFDQIPVEAIPEVLVGIEREYESMEVLSSSISLSKPGSGNAKVRSLLAGHALLFVTRLQLLLNALANQLYEADGHDKAVQLAYDIAVLKKKFEKIVDANLELPTP